MMSKHRFTMGLLAGCLLIGLVGLYHGRYFRPARPSPGNIPVTKKPDSTKKSPDPFTYSAYSTVAEPSSRAGMRDEWEQRWQELMASPDSPERTQSLIALLEKLAETDPARAIGFAGTTTNASLGADLFQAALRGWATGDPDAASAWAASQDRIDRGLAMAAVMHGAVKDPDRAEDLTRRLSEADPARAGDYGSYLIAALGRAGEFDRAAAFATNGPGDARMNWMNAAYGRWAEQSPAAALSNAARLSDPDLQRNALAAAIGGWSHTDPKAVVDYALTLPEGDERKMALATLHSWSENDVTNAAIWLANIDPSPDMDGSAVNIATDKRTLREPEKAVSWANSICDPERRSRALVAVLESWARVDAAAARHHVETSPDLQPEDRETLLQTLAR